MSSFIGYVGRMLKIIVKMIFVLSFSISFIGCGSGSSGDKNKGPVISFDIPETVDEGQTITLSVDASDPDGSIREFNWMQTEGPSVEFTTNRGNITFIAPQVTEDTTLSFLLRVVDNVGAVTEAVLTITVKDVPQLSVALSKMAVNFIGVSESVDYSDYRWFEINNHGKEPINLEKLIVRSKALNIINMDVIGTTEFSLPKYVLNAGQSVKVTDLLSQKIWGSMLGEAIVIKHKESMVVPFWSGSGQLELLEESSNLVVDSITWSIEE